MKSVLADVIGPLSFVFALRNASALATATVTETTVHERNIGRTLRYLPSAQHDYTPPCKSAYQIVYNRTNRAGCRLVTVIAHPSTTGSGGGRDRGGNLIVAAFREAEGTLGHVILRGWIFQVSGQHLGVDCADGGDRGLHDVQTTRITRVGMIGRPIGSNKLWVHGYGYVGREGHGQCLYMCRSSCLDPNASRQNSSHGGSVFQFTNYYIGDHHRRA